MDLFSHKMVGEKKQFFVIKGKCVFHASINCLLDCVGGMGLLGTVAIQLAKFSKKLIEVWVIKCLNQWSDGF